MGDEIRIRTPHAELTLGEVAESLPGTGEVMSSVSRCYAMCWHAAHGGKWDLAAFYFRRTQGLLRGLAVIRPKYAEQLAAFERDALVPLGAALDARDLSAFDRAYDFGVDRANHYHVETGKSYVHWRLPERPPDEGVDLGSP